MRNVGRSFTSDTDKTVAQGNGHRTKHILDINNITYNLSLAFTLLPRRALGLAGGGLVGKAAALFVLATVLRVLEPPRQLLLLLPAVLLHPLLQVSLANTVSTIRNEILRNWRDMNTDATTNSRDWLATLWASMTPLRSRAKRCSARTRSPMPWNTAWRLAAMA